MSKQDQTTGFSVWHLVGMSALWCLAGYGVGFVSHPVPEHTVTAITYQTLQRADCGRLKIWAELFRTDDGHAEWILHPCSIDPITLSENHD